MTGTGLGGLVVGDQESFNRSEAATVQKAWLGEWEERWERGRGGQGLARAERRTLTGGVLPLKSARPWGPGLGVAVSCFRGTSRSSLDYECRWKNGSERIGLEE